MNMNTLIGKKFKLKGSNGRFKQYEIFDTQDYKDISLIYARDKKNQGIELSTHDFLIQYSENKIVWVRR